MEGRLLVYHPLAKEGRPMTPSCNSLIAVIRLGQDRRCEPICTFRLYFRETATSSSPSCGLCEQGFSTYTCLPALQARIAAGACQWSGVAITIASNDLSSSAFRKS